MYRDQLRNPTLGNRVWVAFTVYSSYALSENVKTVEASLKINCTKSKQVAYVLTDAQNLRRLLKSVVVSEGKLFHILTTLAAPVYRHTK